MRGGGWSAMTLAVRGVLWVTAYLGAVLSPLVFAVIGASRPDQGFWTDFSVALGFVGLAMMGLEFAISAQWSELTPANALAAPLLVWFGMAALTALVVLIATSVWRRPLRLSYEAWHVAHAVLAVVLVLGRSCTSSSSTST
jgi:predicted ferric reductase